MPGVHLAEEFSELRMELLSRITNARNYSREVPWWYRGTPQGDKDGSFLMDFFMLFATKFDMVKFEEPKLTEFFHERSNYRS